MAKSSQLRAVRGMNDILPTDEGLWRRFDDAVSDVMAGYGYGRVRTPILEHTNLFVRGIGEVTDIVEKEMYTFTDSLNGDSLTLRPENTAAVVRAVLEHNLTYDGPKRLWYSGPMFRHERPQKGRYRQFHQIGAEVLAASGPEVDAELILLCQRLWDDLALPPIRLEINCLGQSDERAAHRAALIEYFEAHADQLDADATRRLHTNPLRILDTKNPEMRALVDQAPRLADYLGDESRAHFEAVQAILKAQNLPVTVNHQLVRGLDYYNLTVFEWIAPDGLTICGGGRYDPLIEMLGGKASAGCGFAVGVERVLELMRTDMASTGGPSPDVYVIHSGEGTAALGFTAAERLRDAGMNVVLHAGGGSFKSQFKRADASGAHLAIVIGEDEAASGNLTVKHLRNRDAQQQSTGIEALPELVSNFLNEE